MDASTIEEIREQFKRMDKDGSGALDVNDLLIMAAESRALALGPSSKMSRSLSESESLAASTGCSNSPRKQNYPAKPSILKKGPSCPATPPVTV